MYLNHKAGVHILKLIGYDKNTMDKLSWGHFDMNPKSIFWSLANNSVRDWPPGQSHMHSMQNTWMTAKSLAVGESDRAKNRKKY